MCESGKCRKWLRAAVAAGLVLVAGAVGSAGPAVADGAAADVAYHGKVALARGALAVSLTPENLGPGAVANATVRVRASVDLAGGARLTAGCARAGARVVVCETGALPERGAGRRIELLLPLQEAAVREVVVRIDTFWDGGVADGNAANNRHVVLALDTGDTYAF
ncbi:hypothetical protein LG634_31035 [Streptomyces bambusae]|uniref:hypothetical protein n=1 Tax=Streptomyces bambusae TaxID=1550616 RepID=UPI001CFFFDE0|nr:hypothetical protein [Streptomyces bambusae]MCB5169232.1 hypothetical protein [Streptomyces bambusae]